MHHVSWGNLCIVLTCKALGETRATTEKCFLWKKLCCLRNCKAFGGSRCSVSVHACYSAHHFYLHRPGKHSQDLDMFKYRRIEVEIKTRCCIIYLCGETNLHYLLTCKALGETRVTTRKCFMKNLCCLFDWKAVGGSRVKARWYFMYLGGATCPIYLLVRPWVRRELPLEEASCEELVLFTQL